MMRDSTAPGAPLKAFRWGMLSGTSSSAPYTRLTAPGTVPFALWCAAQHLDDYEEALWLTVSGLGDRDTTCAIAGGIVACCTGAEGIPAAWRAAREPLPEWAFGG